MLANFSGGSRILNRGVQRKTALLRVVKFLTPPICRPRLLAQKKQKKKQKKKNRLLEPTKLLGPRNIFVLFSKNMVSI